MLGYRIIWKIVPFKYEFDFCTEFLSLYIGFKSKNLATLSVYNLSIAFWQMQRWADFNWIWQGDSSILEEEKRVQTLKHIRDQSRR